MEGRHYPSDLSDELWQVIEPLLPTPSKRGAPQGIPRRRVIEAILGVVHFRVTPSKARRDGLGFPCG